LPDSFIELKNLTVLELSKNKLKLLPDRFSNLSNLKELYLNQNRLTEFPGKIKYKKDLSGLKELLKFEFSSNKIKILPVELLKIGNLLTLIGK
jgi:Leucine-rich repeat (LRR) protein